MLRLEHLSVLLKCAITLGFSPDVSASSLVSANDYEREQVDDRIPTKPHKGVSFLRLQGK